MWVSRRGERLYIYIFTETSGTPVTTFHVGLFMYYIFLKDISVRRFVYSYFDRNGSLVGMGGLLK